MPNKQNKLIPKKTQYKKGKYGLRGNLFQNGGAMNYKYRGTIFDDDLKNQGITHVAELPEVVVKGRDYTKPYKSVYDTNPDTDNIIEYLNNLNNIYQYSKLYLKNKFVGAGDGAFIDLSQQNVSRITGDSKNIKTILANDFVESSDDAVRRKKDFVNTADTLLGDRQIPLSNISTFYGIENGKLKAGPIDAFDDTTTIVPNRAKNIGKIIYYNPATPPTEAYKAAVQDGIREYNNQHGYQPSFQQKLFNGGIPFVTEPLPWGVLSRNVGPAKAAEISEQIGKRYKRLGSGNPGYAITESGDTIAGYKFNAQPKALFANESGNAAFVSNLRNPKNLAKLNAFLAKNPSYPIMVDNGRYGFYLDQFPVTKFYSGLRNPDDMFIVGTTYNKGKDSGIHIKPENRGKFNAITTGTPGKKLIKRKPNKFQNGGKNIDSAKYFTLTLTEPNGKSEYQEHIDFGYTPEEAISYARETEKRFADAPNSGYIAGELPEVVVTPGYGNATTLWHLQQMIPSKEYRKKFATGNRAGIVSDNEYIDRMYELWKASKKPDWKTKKSFFYRPYYNVLTNTITAPAKNYLAELSHAYQFRHLFPDQDFNYLGLFGDIKIGGKSGYDRVNNPEYQAHSIIAPVLSNYVQGEINYKDIDPVIKKRLYKAKQKTKYQNGGYIITPSGRKTPFIDKRNKSSIIDGGELPEVTITGYAPLRLTTYYPVVSKQYPFTGHSRLDIPIDTKSWEKYFGTDESEDDSSPYIIINKKPKAKDYNLITNNCADAVLKYLNKAFGTNEKPYFFTTPGDVRDYALKHLNGKLIKNKNGSDTVLIPRNSKTADKISTAAVNLYGGDYEGTVFWNYQ